MLSLREALAALSVLAVYGCGAPSDSPGNKQPTASSPMALRAVEADGDEDEIDSESISIDRLLRIRADDGTELAAMLFTPKTWRFPGKRPVVILANSWLFNELEYWVPARKLAAKGYIVLSYATRGFGTSGGRVGVAGPDDIRDVSSMIDWLLTNTRADSERIALGGVSYGAGISLIAAANDPRVKAVVALSGWADMIMSLYGGETVRQVWLDLLVTTGRLLGRLGPEVQVNVDRLKQRREVAEATAWAKQRSPLSYVEALNANGTAIFLANSFEDNLFPPEQLREFFERLQGPKQLYMDRGIHASSSIPGLLGMPSETWRRAYAWLDQSLGVKGRDHQAAEAPLLFATAHGIEAYSAFPVNAGRGQHDLTLVPLNRLRPDAADEAAKGARIPFFGGSDSGASSGIPLASEIVEGVLAQPVQKRIALIDKNFAAVYVTAPQTKSLHLRGAPVITVQLEPHQGPVQLVAYLYDEDQHGVGTLISYGVVTVHEAATEMRSLPLALRIKAYDVAEGHRLVLAIDTRDALYQGPPTSGRYALALRHFGAEVSELALPLVELSAN